MQAIGNSYSINRLITLTQLNTEKAYGELIENTIDWLNEDDEEAYTLDITNWTTPQVSEQTNHL